MSTDRLNILRERNKDLLNQLKQQRDKLEQFSGRSRRYMRGRKDDGEERTDPEENLIRTDGEPGTARAALTKPTARVPDPCEVEAAMMHTIPPTSKHREGAEKDSSDIVQGSKRHLRDQTCQRDTRPANTKSHLLNHREEQGELQSGDAVKPDECDDLSPSDSHHLQPLLGYDWIAGVLEAEDSAIDRPDEFFNELSAFRTLNKTECHHSPQAGLSEMNYSGLPSLMDKGDPEANVDPHKCTFSYRINSRLFPVPLHSQERCPVCRRHKSCHPHTVTEPAHVRVSIPRATLFPPYRYKAHRRCSFDPSDSLGLPSHCLSGWSSIGPGTPPPLSSLDLRSNLNMKRSNGLQDEELEALSVSGNQIWDTTSVSRLARHNFQHFSPIRKGGSSS